MSNAPSSLLRNNLTVLEELDLSGNSLNSLAIPNWLWDVTSLKSLSLRGCELSGTFPDELGNLTLLETFDISSNNIKGMIPGTIVSSKSWRQQHRYGDIREVIERIPSCSWKNFKELHMNDANITGTTLQLVSNLTSLSVLEISGNQLSGSMPVEIGRLTNLTYLDLWYNNLSGVISEDHFSGLKSLKFIDISYNSLELIIDSHWVPPFNLDFASFSSCQLGPQFPKWLRCLKVIELDISNTGLVGKIPHWFWTTFSDATLLDISLNQLSGDLPLSLEFMSLIEFSMHSNLLTGLLPKLPRTIVSLDISRNSLSGFASSF
jgi:uncharacterized protein YjbI with pentapeptide repeats